MTIYTKITASIVAAVEASPGKAVMPWHRSSGLPTNIASGNQYSGINVISLWASAAVEGYSSSIWGTYRQWAAVGAQVRHGEKSSPVVFYKSYQPDWEGDDGEVETRRVARGYSSFNSEQVDGWTDPAEAKEPVLARIASVEAYVSATGAMVIPGGDRAFYDPAHDEIHLPDPWRFFATEDSTQEENSYSTLLHELTHWTGAKHRLDRGLCGRFGSEAYAAEELVAELGAAFQCATLGITCEPRADHAKYIANWLQLLRNDSRAIFVAAAKARLATEFLAAKTSCVIQCEMEEGR